MKDNPNPGGSWKSVRPGEHLWNSTSSRPRQNNNGPRQTPSKISIWAVLDLLSDKWRWCLLCGLICGALAGFAANKFVKPKFTAVAKLLRFETPGASEYLKSATPMSPETFANLLRAPELLQKIGSNATPPIPQEILEKASKVDPDVDSDIVTITVVGKTPEQAVDLVNLYVSNSVEYIRSEEGHKDKELADRYLKKQVERMDEDIAALDKEFHMLALPPALTNKLAQIGGQISDLKQHSLAPSPLLTMQTERLNRAIGELVDLSSKYTDIHPLVVEKRNEVQALRNEVARESTNANAQELASGRAEAAAAMPAQVYNPEIDIVRAKLLSLQQGRVELINRQREAALYADNPPDAARVFAPATMKTVKPGMRTVKIGAAAFIGALFGFAATLALVMLTELLDDHLKSAEDVTRVTHLPVLGTLGEMENMNDHDKTQWAFRTWTMLQGRLAPTADHGLVCGFTSSSEGQGRSTWIRMLAEAASLTGFRVLTVSTRPAAQPNGQIGPGLPGDLNEPRDLLTESPPTNDAGGSLTKVDGNDFIHPALVADRLNDPNSTPVVQIPLPGWVWNRERRQQWHAALDKWKKIENVVIFVELPPADVPEAVLLGSSLPNLVWLSDSRKARAPETREQLETLRHARCNLVGAVLNREIGRPLRKRFARWVGSFTAFAALLLMANQALGQEAPVASIPLNTNQTLSIDHPWQRAAWQQHLTLGPGDAVNLGVFGQPELAVQDVIIGPDGRISYLEAQDVRAAGLTIDELRTNLDQELGKYRRTPHSIVTPVAFRSKKYFVLGKVMVKGTYVLDRPITVLEAIARAKGFENGLINRSVVDLADFSRSFIARNGKRIPLDFQRLFGNGDLSQNVPIEPNDYVYIAGADLSEVYVVGEVRLPGPVPYDASQTAISVITARGGFSERAYRSRVLVVRGSLNYPEYFVVDTAAIVKGRQTDFRLQPKDIVFVSSRPFIRVEELSDLALTAFIQGLITAWVDAKVIQPFPQQ